MLRRWAILAVVAATVLFARTALLQPLPTEAQAGGVPVRALHLSPTAPPADLWFEQQVVFNGLTFGAQPRTASVPPGRARIRGTLANQPQQVLFEAIVDVDPGRLLTVAITGEAPNLLPLVLRDDDQPPPTDTARVRFVHTVPDLGAVDVGARGGPTFFRNVSFRGVGPYQDVPPGTYTLEARLAGSSTVILSVPDVTIRPGAVLTLFGAGRIADSSVNVVAVRDDPASLPAPSPSAAVAPPSPRPLPNAGVGILTSSGGVGSMLTAFALVVFALPLIRRTRRPAPALATAGTSTIATTPPAVIPTVATAQHGRADVTVVITAPDGVALNVDAISSELARVPGFLDVAPACVDSGGVVLACRAGDNTPAALAINNVLRASSGRKATGRWVSANFYVGSIG